MTTRTLKARLVAEDRASSKIFNVKNALIALSAAAILVGIRMARNLVSGMRAATASIVELGSAFEHTMATVRALTQPTTTQFEKLSKAARDLGRTTVFSATEVSAAMEKFALAGFNVNEIMGAVAPTLDLAAAGSLEMARAAEITAGIMRSMNLETSDLNRVVDVLAKAATSSLQEVNDLGSAFSKTGTSAAILGIDVESLAATFAVLANRQIAGEEAGTALRRIFAVMQGDLEEGEAGLAKFDVTLRNLDGTFVGITEAFRRMGAAGVTVDNAMEVFGLRAGQTAQILLQTTDIVDATTESFRKAGGEAKRVGDEKLDSLKGDVIRLKSAWEGLAVELFQQVSPAMRAVTQTLTDMLNATTDAVQGTDTLRIVSINFAIVLLETAASAAVMSAALANAAGTIALTADIVSRLVPGLKAMRQNLEETVFMLSLLGKFSIDAESDLGKFLAKIRESIDGLIALRDAGPFTDDGFIGPIQESAEAMGGLAEKVKVLGGGLLGLEEAMARFIRVGPLALDAAMAQAGESLESLGSTFDEVLRGQGVGAALAMGDALVDAASGAKIAWGDFLKGLIRDMIAAIIRMLILTAIGKAIGGAFGGPAGAAAGSAAGGLVAQQVNSATLVNPNGADLGGLADQVPTVVINAEGAVFLDEGMPARLARQISDGLSAAQQRGVLVGA